MSAEYYIGLYTVYIIHVQCTCVHMCIYNVRTYTCMSLSGEWSLHYNNSVIMTRK